MYCTYQLLNIAIYCKKTAIMSTLCCYSVVVTSLVKTKWWLFLVEEFEKEWEILTWLSILSFKNITT